MRKASTNYSFKLLGSFFGSFSLLALSLVCTCGSAAYAQALGDGYGNPALKPQITPTKGSSTSISPVTGSTNGKRPKYGAISASHLRRDVGTCKKLASYRWLDKMALADPQIVTALTNYAASAEILAKHPHLDKIAEADHYLCRRLTKWPKAARILVANSKCYKVVAYDPEGLYRAIKYDRSIAKRLTKNLYYQEMIVENPELGKVLARYM